MGTLAYFASPEDAIQWVPLVDQIAIFSYRGLHPHLASLVRRLPCKIRLDVFSMLGERLETAVAANYWTPANGLQARGFAPVASTIGLGCFGLSILSANADGFCRASAIRLAVASFEHDLLSEMPIFDSVHGFLAVRHPELSAAAVDLRTRLAELGVGPTLTTDLGNFGHGLYKVVERGDTGAIFFCRNGEGLEVDLRRSVPRQVPFVCSEAPNGQRALLFSWATSVLLATTIAARRNISNLDTGPSAWGDHFYGREISRNS